MTRILCGGESHPTLLYYLFFTVRPLSFNNLPSLVATEIVVSSMVFLPLTLWLLTNNFGLAANIIEIAVILHLIFQKGCCLESSILLVLYSTVKCCNIYLHLFENSEHCSIVLWKCIVFLEFFNRNHPADNIRFAPLSHRISDWLSQKT